MAIKQKMSPDSQMDTQRGLSRLGGAESQGSTPLADDIGSRQAARDNRALADLNPDSLKLTIGGGRQFSDLDPSHPIDGPRRDAFTAESGSNAAADILRGSVAGGLKSRQWKGKA